MLFFKRANGRVNRSRTLFMLILFGCAVVIGAQSDVQDVLDKSTTEINEEFLQAYQPLRNTDGTIGCGDNAVRPSKFKLPKTAPADITLENGVVLFKKGEPMCYSWNVPGVDYIGGNDLLKKRVIRSRGVHALGKYFMKDGSDKLAEFKKSVSENCRYRDRIIFGVDNALHSDVGPRLISLGGALLHVIDNPTLSAKNAIGTVNTKIDEIAKKFRTLQGEYEDGNLDLSNKVKSYFDMSNMPSMPDKDAIANALNLVDVSRGAVDLAVLVTSIYLTSRLFSTGAPVLYKAVSLPLSLTYRSCRAGLSALYKCVSLPFSLLYGICCKSRRVKEHEEDEQSSNCTRGCLSAEMNKNAGTSVDGKNIFNQQECQEYKNVYGNTTSCCPRPDGGESTFRRVWNSIWNFITRKNRDTVAAVTSTKDSETPSEPVTKNTYTATPTCDYTFASASFEREVVLECKGTSVKKESILRRVWNGIWNFITRKSVDAAVTSTHESDSEESSDGGYRHCSS